MDTLHRQIRRARTRLIIEQFVQHLFRTAFILLGVAAVAIAVPKLFVMESLPARWDIIWLFGSACAAVFGACAWTYRQRRTDLDAAIEIDQRFGLKERVASSIHLAPEELETRAGRALIEDTVRRVERIDVAERFGVHLGRRPWAPLIPAAIAFCLLAFVEDRTRPTTADASAKLDIQRQVKTSAEALRKQIEKKKKEAAAKGLPDATGLFKELEKSAEDLAKKEGQDRKNAAVKLNDLAKQLEDRRNSLGGDKEMKQQFEKLNKVGKGPAEKLASAMKEGDFKKAAEELKNLKEKIASGKLDEKSKEQLKEQVNAMKEKLQEATQANKEAMENLKKQVEEQKRQGNTQNAAKLQEQLDKMAKNLPQMDQLGDLAEKLDQLQKSMEQGDAEAAQKALEQMAEQLEGMQQQLEEMEMLGEMIAQIDDAKNAMNCPECEGGGCKSCQGEGQGNGKGDKPGKGNGEGQGEGPRPEEQDDVAFRDSKVNQKQGQGRAVVTGAATGPNRKGDTRKAIQDEIASGAMEDADPLAGERLPRSRREHAESYFNAIREAE